MPQFKQFLQRTVQALSELEKYTKVHVILGNESCDLDSMVSALALAYFYQSKNTNAETIFFPIINGSQSLFRVHTENVHLLQSEEINTDNLIYKDRIDLSKLIDEKKLVVTLVDHHVLNVNDKFLKPEVIEIIDHRSIDKIEEWDQNVDINIDLVASCCTLIVEKMSCSFEMPKSMATMLYKTITFDTLGFDKSKYKVTDRDLIVGEKLEKLLNLDETNRKTLFENLWTVHEDISALTSEQLLYKDLKVVHSNGINVYMPGLPMLVKDYLKREDAKKAIEDFCSKNDVKHLIIMGLSASIGLARDLALYPKDNEVIETIKMGLLDSELGLVGEQLEFVWYFRQSNLKMSRKHLIPLIKNFL